MKTLYVLPIMLLAVAIISCNNSKTPTTETFWVSGTKSQCDAGAGKMMCLNVAKTENIEDAVWENFYASIEGFTFKEGKAQKIKVTVTKLDKQDVPADASSIQYTLKEVLETANDNSLKLDGSWTVSRLNGAPLNKMVSIPTMVVELGNKRISGNTGCNNYSVGLKNINNKAIDIGVPAMTRKACINENVETQFADAFGKVTSYEVDDASITFFDKDGNEVLAFMKNNTTVANTTIHDIWVAAAINGDPLNRMVKAPRLEVNLTDMRVMGNDGCNNYNGDIKAIDAKVITLGQIAKTEKMCRNMEVPTNFHKALNSIATYKVEEGKLMFYDNNGKEMLKFLKVD